MKTNETVNHDMDISSKGLHKFPIKVYWRRRGALSPPVFCMQTTDCINKENTLEKAYNYINYLLYKYQIISQN